MATTIPIPMPDSSRELLPALACPIDDRMEHEEKDVGAGQNRSSSLSEIEDRADEDIARSERNVPTIDSDSNDTEAETERLEDSPQKLRRNQNLVLTAANSVYDVSQSPSTQYESDQARDRTRQDSDAASLRSSSVEGDSTKPILRSPRKRKRSNDEDDESTGQLVSTRPNPDTSISVKKSASECLITSGTSNRIDTEGNSREASDGEKQGSEEDVQAAPVQANGLRSKRRTDKMIENGARLRSPSGSSVNGVLERIGSPEPAESNGEDLEEDDPGEHVGVEDTIKAEEVAVTRKSAMDSLTAIEKCFASLRNKLYDERLAKCDAELAMLEGPEITHPELLSMKEVLEQRRDEKIQYECTLLKYKLGSLQNKSVAEKAQVHTQYMQTVRDIRDRSLEQVNREWYQIHKERRSREDDVPEYMCLYPTRRSQQITNQTAYNKEVSLLSGIAKYRGFPAAPEIGSAKSTEIDLDLDKMGIAQQSAAPLVRCPPPLRASLSANAVLSRPRPVADEHFLEQNPWANPQHPAHLHRQASALSGTASPSATPVQPTRPTEPAEGFKSASTLAEAQKRVLSPKGSTAATGPQDKGPKMTRPGFNPGLEHHTHASTSSKLLPSTTESSTSHPKDQRGGLQKSQMAATTPSEKTVSSLPSVPGRNQGPEIHMKPYVPKMPRRVDSTSATPTSKFPTSPSGRFPVIKAEDISRLPGRSPTPQRYHRPVSVNVTANGASDR